MNPAPVDTGAAANATPNGAGRASGKGGIPWDVVTDLAVFALKIGATLWLGTYLVDKVMDFGAKDSSTSKAKKMLQDRLKDKDLAAIDLSPHEASFVEDIVDARAIEESFSRIGGLEDSIESIRDNLILPFRLFSHVQSQSSVATYPTGLLLYGAPGTGKTMIARAIANETGAVFINVKMANVLSKWVGESDKYVCALFSLARKLAPAVIFIDEIDCFLSHRGSSGGDQQHMGTLQANFLTEWDGLKSIKHAPVVVLGATNRPESIDKAILRRMPLMVRTPMPDSNARRDIIRKMLTLERLEEDVSVDQLASLTDGYSGSDLRELLRVACLQRLKTFDVARASTGTAVLRPLCAQDFDYALQKTNPSQDTARAYAREKQLEEGMTARDDFVQMALASILSAQQSQPQPQPQPELQPQKNNLVVEEVDN